ncbi:hypothetical protein EJ04DRAFT_564123 [Polyplosphaeria fusca]|uniref:Uncharacterized protein n=1 Tax=Polyplosphaeria fusca TaxID=682080 RepID=A0A9P4UZS4_9PLEO|nr:hypothetical protein EJ04DRAFT_564123 [Polyplosphaeria fusca]
METQNFPSVKQDSIIIDQPCDDPHAATNGQPCTTKAEDPRKQEEAKIVFENAVNEELDIPSGYLKTAVLMIRWDEGIDDPSFSAGHTSEIDRLKKLFTGRFNYECKVIKLSTTEKAPQNILNHAISQHIFDHDGPHNLIIIYYTGHGSLYRQSDHELNQMSARANGSYPSSTGRLAFIAQRNGNTETSKKGKYPAKAFWDEAEKILLEPTREADVLSILDCCYASDAHKGAWSEDNRLYELLSATSQYTHKPGPDSFTESLISALEEMLDNTGKPNYSTPRLLDIMRKTRPSTALHDRLRKHEYNISLTPRVPQVKEESFRSIATEEASFKLRFSLATQDFKQEQIEALGRHIPALFKKVKIPLRRVHWVLPEQHKNKQAPRMLDAVNAHLFNQRLKRKASMSILEKMQSESPKMKRKSEEEIPLTSHRYGPYLDTQRRPSQNSEQAASPARSITSVLTESPTELRSSCNGSNCL